MTDEGSVQGHCFFIVQVNTSVVIVDIGECSDSKDGSECVERILYGWSLIREGKGRVEWRVLAD
jgi:hypothetical protein